MKLAAHQIHAVFSAGRMLHAMLIAVRYILNKFRRHARKIKINNRKGERRINVRVSPLPFLFRGCGHISKHTDDITLVFDGDTITAYEEFYFSLHPRAKKKPIPFPYHESINTWMIMKRPMMNALKQRWKDFIVWFVSSQGYANLHIDKCDMCFDTYYKTNRPHDVDNGCPKFIIDGLVESGLLLDDNNRHLKSLTLRCHVDPDRPRTEIHIYNIEY